MQIDDKLLTKLEKLSALKVSEEKRKELEQQLGQIVDFVQKLDELKLDGIEAITSTTTGGTPFREDESCKSSVIEIISKHAPKSQEGFFIVPKIIE
ncbi:Asp-tRNA(Asn)/Glu-tRNA(Gln) amidotransferase subunit GatC [Campylobacter insulaenigrae]|uniref:Aspartyl/glutamyl-tRNA(Asn/Gln) amidotransferase subunit C n=2 Tax=Campylobacter insulaenigrae TaxID=260714 RepID=A0A0A8H3T4_9BACT|nr:Asp-tRNA(Asn)/Glu-tRNA(Gln) amidotransferase subunit GatC [Campylobacter insulaenigrae]AJC87529.1 Glu-tRNA(Gln) amidotransferase, subunit C [Campylobacter insulaenigrae NCTC 12927]MCR6571082.1 Asp-tRNA(Asn)/Glu-tRNA(Gln) amidotransferase subunit GatC [Campylobacter insulaenigrae]MCR6572935.1 Asp-tRNA(Asn)/Glu-tRNA(Gln) amidotransferase subunit GatC [Campylobacter insulaenigrae]MCR6574195.1 Asp-tRNA(Asn)/Glu-tRNA(Gln) amidotransferase subunit GatC [Campylobacter insulaenigrae]MCR6575810.1 As